MIKLLMQIFLQFFHIGLFSFGGGYATLPFLFDVAEKFHWFTINQLTDMIAISSITPGPVGVNMATFTGFATSGILGALIATFAIMLPSFIIVSIVYKILDKFKSNSYVKSVVSSLKPAGCALLCAVGIKLIFTSHLKLIGLIILGIFVICGFIKKRDPIFYLGISAILGFILGHLNWIGV
ncbi:chromate transporter [bacterium]|nr:chromate transporter [bacterium]